VTNRAKNGGENRGTREREGNVVEDGKEGGEERGR
jgi:hypothetical protein